MAKKSLIDDFLTKVGRVFPKDAYILYNKYVIGGKDSEKKNNGYHLITIPEDVNKSLNDLFTNDKVVYVSNTRECKKDISTYTEVIESPDKIVGKLSWILDDIKKIKKWESLKLTDDEINTLYSKVSTLELFKDNDNIPTIIISKSLFPLITEKNINEMFYSVIEKDDGDGIMINELILSFTNELLDLNMIFFYFSL